jgi:hypothetical protein
VIGIGVTLIEKDPANFPSGKSFRKWRDATVTFAEQEMLSGPRYFLIIYQDRRSVNSAQKFSPISKKLARETS